MKRWITFAFLSTAVFGFSGCALMGEVFVTMILPPPPPPPEYSDPGVPVHSQDPPIPSQHRDIHTGRDHVYTDPVPDQNENTKRTRESETQRSARDNSNPAPVRNDDTTTPSRNSRQSRGR